MTILILSALAALLIIALIWIFDRREQARFRRASERASERARRIFEMEDLK